MVIPFVSSNDIFNQIGIASLPVQT